MRVVVGRRRHLVLVIDLAIAERLLGVKNLNLATLLKDRREGDPREICPTNAAP